MSEYDFNVCIECQKNDKYGSPCSETCKYLKEKLKKGEENE